MNAPNEPVADPVQSDQRATDTGRISPQRQDGLRESIESVVVAFILAFLFRTFEAEAFVIPTGSMAPTLYGRHKDVHCEQCGWQFAVSASDEVDTAGYLRSGYRVDQASCPNCGFEMPVKDLPVFNGDRILVNKFPYEIGDPHRWDVAVFKYPEEPKTNYIKRLVGLPHETIVIEGGDLYRETETGEREILRKSDPRKQNELQLLVYDNDHPESELHKLGWPTRWAPVKQADTPDAIAGWTSDTDGWVADTDARRFQLGATSQSDNRLRWLRYRHIVPGPRDWEAIESGQVATQALTDRIRFSPPRPSLITDLYGYNSIRLEFSDYHVDDGYWVGDLTLSCLVELLKTSPPEHSPELLLELNEGLYRYRCIINLTDGQATLSALVQTDTLSAVEETLAVAATPLSDTGQFQVTFANVDNRLVLWIDDTQIDLGPAAEYTPRDDIPAGPQNADLTPVGIAARHADIHLSHLQLRRDIYYRSEHVANDSTDYDSVALARDARTDMELADLRYLPDRWREYFESHVRVARFELGADEFLMLGDNSPRSKDSRLWENARHARHRHAVPRTALIGKAFFIYWPHGVPFLNGGKGYAVFEHTTVNSRTGEVLANGGEGESYPSFRFPFYPQLPRMRRVR